MVRERWFWAQARRRRGPVLLPELVECLLEQLDPRAVLVWRKGLAEWTRAEEVSEVQRRIGPVIARREAEATARRASARAAAAVAAEPQPPPARPAPVGSNVLVYGGVAAGVAALALLAWLFWPRPHSAPRAVPLGGSTTDRAPAVVLPAGSVPGGGPGAAPAGEPPAAPSRPPAVSVAAGESDVPTAELRKIRGVAAWSGDRLTLTVYNGTGWRVTEIGVRIARFDGDQLVEDANPLRLLPPGGDVAAGVADLLSKVAPDRKKPGLNPLDTGPFEGVAGARPENFRWEIESARGYAPR
jgi:hypothetical protein